MKIVKIISVVVALLALGGCASGPLGFGCCESVVPTYHCCD